LRLIGVLAIDNCQDFKGRILLRLFTNSKAEQSGIREFTGWEKDQLKTLLNRIFQIGLSKEWGQLKELFSSERKVKRRALKRTAAEKR